jgi:hypothetical protein
MHEEKEGVRFELTRPFGLPVFKTGAINRSATPPGRAFAIATNYFHYSATPSEITLQPGWRLGALSVGVVRAFPRHFDMFMRTWNYGQAEVRARD